MKTVLKYSVALLSLVVGAVSASAFELYPGCKGKKYLAAGWEFSSVSAADLLAHAEKLDQTPFDGVVFNPNGATVEQLRQFREHRSLRYSFASGFGVKKSGRLEWTDDAAWAQAARDLAAVGRLVRDAELPGIKTDAEDYYGFRQFFRKPHDLPWEELTCLVRRRGRETFAALFEAYPTVTVLHFFAYSNTFFMRRFTDVVATARENGDLWPAFLDGILDALPPTATMIEGNENSYKYSALTHGFERSRTAIYNWLLPLVAKENHTKYLTQMKLASAIYMDMYVTPSNSSWYHGPVDGSRVTHLLKNVEEATGVSDGYVWFWCESGRWIDWSEESARKLHHKAKRLWTDQLSPQLCDELSALKDPEVFYRRRILSSIAQGSMTNLVRGPLSVWQADPNPKDFKRKYQEKGTVQREPDDRGGFRYRLTGVARGCVHLNVDDVKGGELFYVRFRMRGMAAQAEVSFKSKNRWMSERIHIYPVAGDPNDWRQAEALVRILPEAESASFTFGSKAISSEQTAEYDQIEVYRRAR